MKQQLYWTILLLSAGTIGVVVFQPGLISLGTSLIGLKKSHSSGNVGKHFGDEPNESMFGETDLRHEDGEHESFYREYPKEFESVVFDFPPDPASEDESGSNESLPENPPEIPPSERESDPFTFEDIEEFTMIDASAAHASSSVSFESPENSETSEDYGFEELNDFTEHTSSITLYSAEDLVTHPPDEGSGGNDSPVVGPPVAESFVAEPFDMESFDAGPLASSLQNRTIAAPPAGNVHTPAAPDVPPAPDARQSERVTETPREPSFREDGRLHVASHLVDVVPCPGAETVARVGMEVILGCDILPEAKKLAHFNMKDALEAMTPQQRAEVTEEQIQTQTDVLVAQIFPMVLEQQVQQTLLYCDFLSERSKEEMEAVEKRIDDIFEDSEVPVLMTQFDVKTRNDLNTILERTTGGNLQREKAIFKKKTIAQIVRGQKIQDAEGECSYEEMREYYDAHKSEFFHEARAKWMQLSVRVNSERSLEEARQKLIFMANEVLRGVPFEQVAAAYSDGLHARQGGRWDWISRGSLVSKTLEDAIFTAPVGALSPMIEDASGVHLVKVVAREEAYHTPFRETQAAIRKKIKELRRNKKEAEYLVELTRKFKPETYQGTILSLGRQETKVVLPQGVGTSLHRR